MVERPAAHVGPGPGLGLRGRENRWRTSSVEQHVKYLVLAVLALGLLAGCGSSNGGGSNEATVDLTEQNGSGESGTATLTADGKKTKVVISLDHAPSGTPQPAHIHKGSCKNLDPNPALGLQNVVAGKSTTAVNEPLDDLRKEDYAINVHKSGADLKTYVACGDIGSGSGGSSTDTGGGNGY